MAKPRQISVILITALKRSKREAGIKEGQPWPDDWAADEYDELSRRYQEAWDGLFVGKLKTLGEHDVADLYLADPDEFARSYEAGLEQFQAIIEADEIASPDDLVRVASYINEPQAQLARLELAKEGIPSALGNANLVYWYWLYSNATGGVTVHIRRGDWHWARILLDAVRSGRSEDRPSWTCRFCGQRIGGEWEACWHCGCSMDDAAGELPEPVAPPPDNGRLAIAQQMGRLIGAAAILLFVLLPFALGLIVPALANAVYIALLIYLLGRFASLNFRRFSDGF